MTGMLLPLWVLLSLLGSNLGMTNDQVADKYVYFSPGIVDMPRDGYVYAGFACDRRLFTAEDSNQGMCGDLPDGTLMLFPEVIDPRGGWDYARFLIRHETEHLLRGMDGPAEDRYDEAAADAAGCAVATPGWWCGNG